MPIVRLAGTISGAQDPNRETRAQLLYKLFREGWDIYNSNGDQRISLANIEKKIIESDAFVFTPGATLEDLFKAVSVFVGYQTLDPHLANKPTVLLNSDKSWDPLFELFFHLNRQGMIRQHHPDYLLLAEEPAAVLNLLATATEQGVPVEEHLPSGTAAKASYEHPLPDGHVANVCVFCSASTRDEGFLEAGYAFGKMLAQNDLGCVSGAGSSGIMGEVVRGAYEAGGWTGGSNVPHIIELEGLPVGLSSFWLRPDIYTRMEVMIENSDAFVIFPGGAGTVQEMLALMIFKDQQHPSMVGKPVFIYNRAIESGGFWDPLIELLNAARRPTEFTPVENLDDLVPTILQQLTAAKASQ